jgi:hypothetical protein
MNSRRLIVSPALPPAFPDYSIGDAANGMGVRGQFAPQQRGAAHVSDGSFTSILACARGVRFPPDSDRTADMLGGPSCAKSRTFPAAGRAYIQARRLAFALRRRAFGLQEAAQRTISAKPRLRQIAVRPLGGATQSRRAALIVAISIFLLPIIASNARFASSPPVASASISTRGVICQKSYRGIRQRRTELPPGVEAADFSLKSSRVRHARGW